MARRQFVKKFVKTQKMKQVEIEIPEKPEQGDLIKIFNWYNNADYSDAVKKGWVLEYAKDNLPKKDVARLKKVHERFFTGTISTVCRLMVRGCITEQGNKFLANHMPALVARAPEPPKAEKEVVKKPTIQDRILEQARVFMAEVDYFVDEKVTKDKEHSLKPVLGDTGAPQAKHVIAHIDSYIKEFTDVKELAYSKNKEDKEYYDAYGMGIRGLNSVIKYLESIKAEAELFITAKKKARKVTTRKKKVKSPVELCKNAVTFENTLLKPTKLIGSGYAVIYHEKYRTFTYLIAEDAGGLSVSGKTVTGFDAKKSQVFTVKKRGTEAEIVKEINSKTGINALKKIMNDDSKLRESKGRLSGRLSDQANIIQAI